MIPGVDLTRLVNDALAAVRAGVPGVSLRSFLLQQGLASGGGNIVLVVDGAALRGRLVGRKEELVVLAADLADGASAEGGNRSLFVQAQVGGPGVIGTHAQTGLDDAVTGGSVVLLIQIDGHLGGEAAHGVAADRDLTVALCILGNVVLAVHVLCGIPQRSGPEVEEAAGIVGVPVGMAVVIHIQCQHDIAAAGHLDGGLVLHLGTVQVAVGGHDGGVRVGGVHALGHVQQARKGAGVGIKGNAGDLDLVE